MRSIFLATMTCLLLPGAMQAATIDFTAPERVWLDEFTRPVPGGPTGCGWDFACFEQSGYEFGTSFYMDSPGISLDDDSGGLIATPVNRTDGKRFSVSDVEIDSADGGWSLFQAGPGPNPIPYEIGDDAFWEAVEGEEYLAWAQGEYQGILYGIYGYRDGVKVASKEFGAVAPGKFVLDSSFSALDHLTFEILLPSNLVSRLAGTPAFKEVLKGGQFALLPLEEGDLWCGEYCTVFGISGMTAFVDESDPAPVPLPATMPMLAAALALGALLRRRASRTA